MVGIEEASGSSLKGIVSSGDPLKVTFDVSQVWKGLAYETLSVDTARSGASCGYDFDEGRQYLVYADNTSVTGEDPETLQVGLCSETSQVTNAGAVTLLGESGSVPSTEDLGSQTPQNDAVLPETGGVSLAAIGIAFSGVAAVLLVRRWYS